MKASRGTPLSPELRDAGRWNRRWANVVVVASGPSVSPDQTDLVEQARRQDLVRVIAVSNNWLLLPGSDVLFSSDGKWWKQYVGLVRSSGYQGELWTQDEKAAPLYGLQHVPSEAYPGLTRFNHRIHSGGNSGYMAMNLAYLFGARRILLVGFDNQATGGAKHWFGDHPKGLAEVHPYSLWAKRYAELADDLSTVGVTVLNCTRITALACFPREDLNRALFHYGAPA